MHWCETCEMVTPGKTKVRLTKDGLEIIIHNCAECHTRTEVECYSFPMVRFSVNSNRKKK